jgi:hypothetical protein
MYDDFEDLKPYATDVPDAPNVWVFDSTGGAYDATQVEDDIHHGDILLIPSEGVAGWLNEAWPVAATEAHGELHVPRPEALPEFADKITEVLAVWDEYQSRASA